MGLSFTIAAGPCQRSLPRVLVPWELRPYFTVSDLRLPFSSPPTTRRVTVEVFELSLSLYVTTDGQSASLTWNKAPIWGLRPDLFYRRTVAGLLMWGALSDGRTCLSFTIAAGPCQRSLPRVLVPWDSRPYFTVSDLRLPISSPPTTRRITVEVFDPSSTRVSPVMAAGPRYIASALAAQKNRFQKLLYCSVLHSRYLGNTVSLAPQFLLWANMPQYTHRYIRNFT
jgi:hypothetical protein